MDSNEPTQCAEKEEEMPQEKQPQRQTIWGKEVPEDCPIVIVIA